MVLSLLGHSTSRMLAPFRADTTKIRSAVVLSTELYHRHRAFFFMFPVTLLQREVPCLGGSLNPIRVRSEFLGHRANKEVGCIKVSGGRASIAARMVSALSFSQGQNLPPTELSA